MNIFTYYVFFISLPIAKLLLDLSLHYSPDFFNIISLQNKNLNYTKYIKWHEYSKKSSKTSK